jgi:hypothetical protein
MARGQRRKKGRGSRMKSTFVSPVYGADKMRPHSVRRPIRLFFNAATSVTGSVTSILQLDTNLYANADFVSMASLYRHVKVNRIALRVASGVMYAQTGATAGTPVAIGYNPGIYVTPGSLTSVLDLENSLLMPSINAAPWFTLDFRPQYDNACPPEGPLSSATSFSTLMGSLQIFSNNTPLLSVTNAIVGELTFDCLWSGIN